MSYTTTENESELERLRADYKGAFDEWATQVTEMQRVSETEPCSPAVQEAKKRVEEASIVYRDSRNRLAEDMIERSTSTAA